MEDPSNNDHDAIIFPAILRFPIPPLINLINVSAVLAFSSLSIGDYTDTVENNRFLTKSVIARARIKWSIDDVL